MTTPKNIRKAECCGNCSHCFFNDVINHVVCDRYYPVFYIKGADISNLICDSFEMEKEDE